MFQLRKVSFTYPGKGILFKDFDLDIGYGEFTILQGPSGSGKSTLLYLLNGLRVPQAGVILYRGRELKSYNPLILRRRVVYLQQLPVMLDRTVRENLLLPFTLRVAEKTPQPGDDLLRSYLNAFLLNPISLEDNALNLSVGQRQRLALIRALLLEPEVLLLDEPTASLDRESRSIVEDKVETLNLERGIGVVMISHTDYLPRKVQARRLVMENGQVREV